MKNYIADTDLLKKNLRILQHSIEQLRIISLQEQAYLDTVNSGMIERPTYQTTKMLNELEAELTTACNSVAYMAEAYRSTDGSWPTTSTLIRLISTQEMVLARFPHSSTKSKSPVRLSTPTNNAAVQMLPSLPCLMECTAVTVYVTAVYPLHRVRKLPDPDNIRIKNGLDFLARHIGIDDKGDNLSLVIRAIRSDAIADGLYLLAVPQTDRLLSLSDVITMIQNQSDPTFLTTTTKRRTISWSKMILRRLISAIRSLMA